MNSPKQQMNPESKYHCHWLLWPEMKTFAFSRTDGQISMDLFK